MHGNVMDIYFFRDEPEQNITNNASLHFSENGTGAVHL
jgi:hypothetical protein